MTDEEFDAGFQLWMSTAIECERLKRQKKPIPVAIEKDRKKANDWLNSLSGEEYMRLIS